MNKDQQLSKRHGLYFYLLIIHTWLLSVYFDPNENMIYKMYTPRAQIPCNRVPLELIIKNNKPNDKFSTCIIHLPFTRYL